VLKLSADLSKCEAVHHHHLQAIRMAHNEGNNGSRVRQNFPEECEGLLNKQINLELYASYVYMSMAYYFDRDDVNFPGMHKFFKKSSDEEREHAEKLLKYQGMRGGKIFFKDINKPTNDEWGSPLEAMQAALSLEKTVNETLLELHKVASERGDAHLTDYLEAEFLDEQVKSIKELSGFITQLQRVGSGLGEYLFDKEFCE